MNSYYNMYIKRMMNNLLTSIYPDKIDYVFIKRSSTADSTNINNELLKNEFNNRVKILCHQFNPNKMQIAYEPFFQWIKELYYEFFSTVSSNTFFQECKIYPLYIDIFQNYFANDKITVNEPVNLYEYDYEQEMFIESMVNTLLHISETIPLFFILNDCNVADYGTLQIIKNLMCFKESGNISFIVNYNEFFNELSHCPELWNKIIEKAENDNSIIQWDFQDSSSISVLAYKFVPIMSELDNYFTNIQNMIYSFSIEQANYYLKIISDRIETERLNIPENKRLKLTELYAIVSLFRRDTTTTFLLCDNMKHLYDENDIQKEYIRKTIICLNYLYSTQIDAASKVYNDCKRLAEKGGDKDFPFYSELLYYILKCHGWQNILFWDKYTELSDDFLDSLEKRGYKNYLAYFLTLGYGGLDMKIPNTDIKVIDSGNFKKGMRITNEIQNNYLLVKIWKKNIMISQYYGNYKNIDYYYKECFKILDKQHNFIDKSNTYTGYGYIKIVNEQYDQATEYFNKAVELYYENNMPEKITECLYNMALNCIIVKNYEMANEYLMTTLKIMEYLDMKKIPICNMSKVYGMIVLCNIKLDIDYNVHMYFNKMHRVLKHTLGDGENTNFRWFEDLYFYYFTYGLMMKKYSKFREAIEAFEKAKYYMLSSTGNHFFSYAQFSLEYADLYDNLGDTEKKNEILTYALSFCTQHGYKHKEQQLAMKLYNYEFREPIYNVSLRNVTLKQLIELAKRIGLEKSLERKNKEIKFLTAWQDTLNRNSLSLTSLVNSAVVTMKDYFNLDDVLYFNIKDNAPNVIYSSDYANLDKSLLIKVSKYFEKHKQEFLISRLDDKFEDYQEIINIYGINQVVSMICIPLSENEKLKDVLIVSTFMHDNFLGNNIILDNSTLTILKIAFKQVVNALYNLEANKEIELMNKRLKLSATTDALTGILNRTGFNSKVEAYLKELQYLPESSKIATALYLDLDNFKFYNDTFGHDIGDIILIKIAHLLTDIVSSFNDKNCYVIRYGGDEFIILLCGKDIQQGVSLAENVYKLIDENQAFIPIIKQKLGRNIDVSSDKYISCSIGISSGKFSCNDDLTEILKFADEALYESKRTGKSKYTVNLLK